MTYVHEWVDGVCVCVHACVCVYVCVCLCGGIILISNEYQMWHGVCIAIYASKIKTYILV